VNSEFNEKDPQRWLKMMEGKPIHKHNFQLMKGQEVGLQWIEEDENAMKEPVIIEVPDGLRMQMPSSNITVEQIAEKVGPNTPLEVIGTVKPKSLNYNIISIVLRCCLAVSGPWIYVRNLDRLH
jgi:hypothetical protein